MKVRRYYTKENETHNARNIEQIAQGHPSMTKQGGFCKTCNRWSVALNAAKWQCKQCVKRASDLDVDYDYDPSGEEDYVQDLTDVGKDLLREIEEDKKKKKKKDEKTS